MCGIIYVAEWSQNPGTGGGEKCLFLSTFALFFLELEDRCYILSENFKIQDVFVGPIHFKTVK